MKKYSLLVVGAGAAGISAAKSAYESGCKSIAVLDENCSIGGILPQCSHRGFGLSIYGEELTGIEMSEKLKESISRMDIDVFFKTTVLSINDNKYVIASSENGLEEIAFDHLILATGCREIPINSLLIPGTRPQGIYTAGEAQKMINVFNENIGEEVLIVGSGDLGMIMARQFSQMGKEIMGIIEKEDHYGAMARNYHRCIEGNNIKLMLSTEIVEICGEKRVSGVKALFKETGEIKLIECDTLISALGLIPERRLIEKISDRDWISVCGNSNRVFDIVDSAMQDAIIIGKQVGGEYIGG